MKFTIVWNSEHDEAMIYAVHPTNRKETEHVCTIMGTESSNPIIKWHIPFGIAGTRQILDKFRTWKAERDGC